MMSLFSRLFGKAPPSSAPPVSPQEPPRNGEVVPSARSVPDRTQVAITEEETLKAAIGAHEGATIARLVIEGTSTRVRQLAARAVEDPEMLRQLIRDVRGGKDKSVYKILTSKRDLLLEQERKLEQLRAEIQAAQAALERHSLRSYDPLFTPTLEQLEIRWKAVAAQADAQVAQKVQQSIDTAREVIALHLREVAAVASRELAAANAAAEAQRLREIEEKAAAASAAERAQVREAQQREQAQKQEAHELALRQIGGLIRKALGALNEGGTGRAAGLRRAIEEKLPFAPALPAYLASQLQRLDTKLAELKDWKSFSVTPKRLELMEDMEALIDSTLEPPVLAERIKDLQEQWRTLSKGAGENLEADWERFHAAAQTAYQPCREYFEAQALVRQENMQRREALLARLAAFEAGHSWEQPDWRMVSRALRESKQQWRQYSPVDRVPGRALQERFAALTSSLQGRLDAEYASNVKQKQGLIERARQLVASEDSRKAIDAVKDLQQKWRAVGPVPRESDHSLWEEFRQQCDAVFQRRQQEFAEYTAGLQTNKANAIRVCEELEKIAAMSGPELLQNVRNLPDLRAAFEAAGEFPRGDERGLRGRFERALDHCEESVAQQQARAAERSWNDLFEAANRVRAWRLAAVSEREALRQAAESYVASVEKWPKGGLEAIKQALAREDGGDVAANAATLKMLCIRAEILTDRATPPEDQPLRREYQVQRLIQNMGQGITADEAQLDSMALEWIGVGPIEEATYEVLLDRFSRCRQR